MRLTFPPKTRKLVNKYFNIKAGPFTVDCPYFQNVADRGGEPVFLGKGLPQEIEAEFNKILGLRPERIKTLEPPSVRHNMVMANLGIDCSGFAVRILDSFLSEKGLGNIRKNTKPRNLSPFSLLRHNFRPYTSISANDITSLRNCLKIIKLNDVLPGDLIRIGSIHVVVVTEVEKVNGRTKKITYCHSTWDYFDQHGVRKGNIIIKNLALPLEKQSWDEYYRGRNWVLEDFLKAKEKDRGIRRLKSFSRD